MLSFAILACTVRKYVLLSVLAMLVPANQSCFFNFDFSIASDSASFNENGQNLVPRENRIWHYVTHEASRECLQRWNKFSSLSYFLHDKL